MPPNRACEEDEGRPKYQGDQVPYDRADERGEQDPHPLRTLGVWITPSLTVLATPGSHERAGQVHDGCHRERHAQA
ncbi:hypothetical protein SHIRM173S_10930 [Streptomyces hirsutus]